MVPDGWRVLTSEDVLGPTRRLGGRYEVTPTQVWCDGQAVPHLRAMGLVWVPGTRQVAWRAVQGAPDAWLARSGAVELAGDLDALWAWHASGEAFAAALGVPRVAVSVVADNLLRLDAGEAGVGLVALVPLPEGRCWVWGAVWQPFPVSPILGAWLACPPGRANHVGTR